jgi:hypothetical protein
MKTIQILILFFLGAGMLHAQEPCIKNGSTYFMYANEIKASLNANGKLFNANDLAAFSIPSQGQDISTIYVANWWLAGLDEAQNLLLSTPQYASGRQPGPLDGTGNPAGNCDDWNRVFAVKRTDIFNCMAEVPFLDAQSLVTKYPSVAGWPAHGNPHLEAVYGFPLPADPVKLAPFFDANTDGLYDPLDGDFPVVELLNIAPFVPDELAWVVYNDAFGVGPIGMEYQMTAWAFSTPTSPVMNRTLFTNHTLTYKSAVRLDSVSLGLWADVDLGCADDDYVGFLPEQNAMFAYNMDPVDGIPGLPCNFVPNFGDQIPVQSVTLLNRPWDKFMYYNINSGGSVQPSTVDPSTPADFYNYLNGSWRDGTPLTTGGSGYNPGLPNPPADFAFPGNPADSNEWSMCTAGLSYADRRVLGIVQFDSMVQGQTHEFLTAWTYHREYSLPCNLGNSIAEMDSIRLAYNNNFQGIVSANNIPRGSFHVEVQPNPASNQVWLTYKGVQPDFVWVFDQYGRLWYNNSAPTADEILINTANWPAGMYFIRVDNGKTQRRIPVLVVH